MRRFSTGYLGLFMLLVLFTGQSFAATYYVDFASGNDASSGTAKTAPWKRAPGMQGFTGHYTHQSGDQFIFKGGVTWDSTCFSLDVPGNGTASNPDYYGVDQSWYAGTAWSRPIFDGGWVVPVNGSMVRLNSVSYVTIDNIEIRNLKAPTNWGPAMIHVDSSNNITVKNSYLHGWDLVSGIATDDAHGGYVSGGPTSNNVVDHTTISNAEMSATKQQGVCIAGASTASYVTCNDAATACLGCVTVHDSTFYDISYPHPDFDASYHTNGIYEIGNGSVYNNLIYNFGANAAPLYPNPGSSDGLSACQDWTQYVYNNVVMIPANGPGVPVLLDVYANAAPAPCGSIYIWNNTLATATMATCVRVAAKAARTMVVENNYCVNSDGSNQICAAGGLCPSATLTVDHNLTQSIAAASAQKSTAANYYSPTSSGAITVGAGSNLSGKGIANLNLDKIGVARPPSGVWDVGAYEFVDGSLQAPTGLAASVQ